MGMMQVLCGRRVQASAAEAPFVRWRGHGGTVRSRSVSRIVLLAFALPAALRAQTTAPNIDGARLPLEVDTFRVYLIRGHDTTETGFLIDALRADGGRLTRVYDQRDLITGHQLDTIVSRLPDLSPVSYHDQSKQRIAQLEFALGRVDGWTRLPDGESLAVHERLPAGVFDGTSYDLVIRAADLRDSLQLTVPSFILGPNTVSAIVGRVYGSDSVDGADCWRFRANFTGMPVTFWIDKRTRALRRQLMQPTVDLAVLFAKPRKRSRGGRAT